MMSKKPEIEICMHCGKVITRQRTPDGHPKFAWKAGEPNAAALEIREKYNLNHLPFGTEVKVIVDYKMDGYDKPEHSESEK